jgi:flagellar basal-body rod protein FlgF
MPVLGNAGPIALPPADKIEIGQDGTISIRAEGEGPNVLAEVDRVKLVNPDLASLRKGEDGLMRVEGEGEQLADGAVRVASGFLETSNVNAVAEMTAMLSLARQFELHIKMMRTAEENSQVTNKILQIS